jgi:hypothetical protein
MVMRLTDKTPLHNNVETWRRKDICPEFVFQFVAIIQDPCQPNGAKYLYLQNSMASGLHLKLLLSSFDVHKSVHRDTSMKIITKGYYTD